GPDVDAPMVISALQSFLKSFIRADFGSRWLDGEMRKRFGSAVEDEPDAHSGREQHGQPSESRKFGTVRITAETDFSVRADDNDDDKNQQKRYDHQVIPAESCIDISSDRACSLFENFRC